MFCKASVVTDFLSSSILVVSIDLSTAGLALGLQCCLEMQGIVSWTKLEETFLGLESWRWKGQQVEAFRVFRRF